jgi:hypothetical protein
MKNPGLLFTLVFLLLTACADPHEPHAVLASPVATALPPPVTASGTVAPVTSPPALPTQDTCNPPTNLVGQSKDVLKTMKFVGPVRILGPDSVMTMDYSPARLNIIVSKDNIIKSVKCG